MTVNVKCENKCNRYFFISFPMAWWSEVIPCGTQILWLGTMFSQFPFECLKKITKEILPMCRKKWGGGGVLKKILRGVRGLGFCNHTLGYGDQGTKSYLWLRKWVKMKPLIIGNITKLTNFEAILHEICQIWYKFCHLLRKNGGIRSKWPKFAENIPLATEP